MKTTKRGNKYRITYRCPDFQKTIHESFDTEEEANLRIAQIELDKLRGTLLPPAEVIDASSPTAILRSALNQAIRWDYLRGSNPAMAVELPKYKNTKREAWTDQEARQALACCDDPFLLLPMYLALGCSMRIGEILGLT